MSKIPTVEELAAALKEAGSAHHEYETVTLKGVYDEFWPGFYAAYCLGKLGNFTTPSVLAKLLEESPESENWSATAALTVHNALVG